MINFISLKYNTIAIHILLSVPVLLALGSCNENYKSAPPEAVIADSLPAVPGKLYGVVPDTFIPEGEIGRAHV